MDLRPDGTPRLVERLDAVNRRHPWSHNDHFHSWIVRRLPDGRDRALDVGCGRGKLVGLLAEHFRCVEGVDADLALARIAAQRFAGNDRVVIRHAPFARVVGRYDVITMVAVLHHLDLEPALRHAARLLTDHGRLLVVGLARVATPVDAVWDLASAALNPVMGMVKHPRSTTTGPTAPPFPVADPTLTFGEISTRAQRLLPGVRVRRRLFFRYTLEWTKPSRRTQT